MIIFVNPKYYNNCINKSYIVKDNHWSISPTPNFNLVDASYFVPKLQDINEYLTSGNKEKYIENYKRYLSQPNMMRLIILSVLMSDELPGLYFHYDDIAKELLYPKILRDFMINNLEIPKSRIIKYKDFDGIINKLPKETLETLCHRLAVIENKCDEVFDVLR